MAGLAWRKRGVAHLAEVLVTCSEARTAEMRASDMGAPDRVTRKSAAMSAMPAKVMPAAVVTLKTVTSAVAMSAATASTMAAAALGDGIARQHHHKDKSRNSQRAPSHGTLPAVTPLISRRAC
jgi:hypothetical protein